MNSIMLKLIICSKSQKVGKVHFYNFWHWTGMNSVERKEWRYWKFRRHENGKDRFDCSESDIWFDLTQWVSWAKGHFIKTDRLPTSLSICGSGTVSCSFCMRWTSGPSRKDWKRKENSFYTLIANYVSEKLKAEPQLDNWLGRGGTPWYEEDVKGSHLETSLLSFYL